MESTLTTATRTQLKDPNDSDPDASPYTVLPPSLHRMALRFFHDGTGHPGHMRTRSSIQTQYYWPGMERDTEEYVNNCTFCARRKPATSTATKRPLGRHPIPTRPMQQLHIDLTYRKHRATRITSASWWTH